MIARVSPSRLTGAVCAPPSKSVSQRAIALSYLHNGNCTLSNIGQSEDEMAALRIIRSLGADFHAEDGSVAVSPTRKLATGEQIDCGESGLSCRMFVPIAALQPNKISFTGSGSLLKRPMAHLRDILPQLGIQVEMNGDTLPLAVKGPLTPNDIRIDGSASSQYLTGLLFALAAANQRVTISVSKLTSKPYIDLSLQLLTAFGYDVRHEGYEHFTIYPVSRSYSPFRFQIEGDWSNAAFWLVAGAITGDIRLSGLDQHSLQADRRLMDLLKKMEIDIQQADSIIHVKGNGGFGAFEFDATNSPDLFPPLAILAANARGTSVIRGIQRLRSKESDRLLSLEDMLSRIGIHAMHDEESLFITGAKSRGAELSSYGDHRIAMAAAIAGISAEGVTVIHGVESVNKSYPAFFRDLQSLGGALSLQS